LDPLEKSCRLGIGFGLSELLRCGLQPLRVMIAQTYYLETPVVLEGVRVVDAALAQADHYYRISGFRTHQTNRPGRGAHPRNWGKPSLAALPHRPTVQRESGGVGGCRPFHRPTSPSSRREHGFRKASSRM